MNLHLGVSPESLQQQDTQEVEVKPLTADEALEWRKRNVNASPWKVMAWQAAVGGFLAVVVSFGLNEWWGLSFAYGVMAVTLPAALMIRGVFEPSLVYPGSLMVRFLVWELVKIVLTVCLLLAAPLVVPRLSWFALVLGFIVTIKVHWLVFWMYPRAKSSNSSI